MSQDFRFNLQGATEKAGRENVAKTATADGSNVRNLAFEWLDGRRKFLNYAYLITAEFNPDDDTITLGFTTDTVVIKGQNLNILFEQLLYHIPKYLRCTEERYNSISEDQYAVNHIMVNKA